MKRHVRASTIGLLFVWAVLIATTASQAVLKVNGRFVYDGCGEKVIFRGVEHMLYYHDQGGSNIPEIAKTGANCVRLMLDASISATDLDARLTQCEQNKMFVSICLWKGYTQHMSWWTQADIKTVIKKHEDYVTLHAYGEAEYGGDTPRWISEAKGVITLLRNAGYKAPIDILSTSYGRDPTTIINNGLEVFNSDPEKNVIFGCQMYWGPWYTDNQFKMTIAQGCQQFAQLSFPVQVGACPSDCGNTCWRDAWNESWKNELGCLWWSWRGDEFTLTEDVAPWGIYGRWSSYGNEICISGDYSIQKTSKRTYFQMHGLCNPNPTSIGTTKNSARVRFTSASGAVRIFDIAGRMIVGSSVNALTKSSKLGVYILETSCGSASRMASGLTR